MAFACIAGTKAWNQNSYLLATSPVGVGFPSRAWRIRPSSHAARGPPSNGSANSARAPKGSTSPGPWSARSHTLTCLNHPSGLIFHASAFLFHLPELLQKLPPTAVNLYNPSSFRRVCITRFSPRPPTWKRRPAVEAALILPSPCPPKRLETHWFGDLSTGRHQSMSRFGWSISSSPDCDNRTQRATLSDTTSWPGCNPVDPSTWNLDPKNRGRWPLIPKLLLRSVLNQATAKIQPHL